MTGPAYALLRVCHQKLSLRDHNREMKSVYFELFGQTNIPGHQIKYPKFDPVLYNKRRTDKLHPYKIQLTMTNPVRLQDKKVFKNISDIYLKEMQ